MHDPAVDALVNIAVRGNDARRADCEPAALDRVLRHGHYVVPHWLRAAVRVAYGDRKFERPGRGTPLSAGSCDPTW